MVIARIHDETNIFDSTLPPVSGALCPLRLLFSDLRKCRRNKREREVVRLNEKLREEIDSHQKTNMALMESRAMFHAAMDYSQAGIAIAKTPDGKLLDVNDSALNIRGEAKERIVDGIGIDEYVFSW